MGGSGQPLPADGMRAWFSTDRLLKELRSNPRRNGLVESPSPVRKGSLGEGEGVALSSRRLSATLRSEAQEGVAALGHAIQYPSEVLLALQQEPEEFEQEARLVLALRLYEKRKLSTGLAAKLAGVPRSAFLSLLGQHGLSPFGETAEDLAEGLADARRAGRRE